MTRKNALTLTAIGASVLMLLGGCSKNEEAAKPIAATATVRAAGASKDKAAMKAILAKADLVDGEADHIISKCAGCKLGMDGESIHATKRGNYTLHFCSEHCKDTFSKDIKQSILALHVPED